MLADKTLLSITLAATFAAGCVSGWNVHEARTSDAATALGPPRSAEVVYARQLGALRDAGYDDAEMRDATAIHQRYLDRYHQWWSAWLEAHSENLDLVDAEFAKELEGLRARFEARRGGR